MLGFSSHSFTTQGELTVTVGVGRLVVIRAAAPTAGTTYTMRQGDSFATDFALTSGLTTDLNPWCEFSTNIFALPENGMQFVSADDGISVTEKLRS